MHCAVKKKRKEEKIGSRKENNEREKNGIFPLMLELER
jgi:hypothetical protein